MSNPEFTVTDGTVEYKHSRPQGENYDNKTPMVRLSFTVAEGADPAVATAKVMGIAMEVVERANFTNVVFQPAIEQLQGQQVDESDMMAATLVHPKRTRRTKAQIEADTAAAAAMVDPTEGLAPTSDAAPSGSSLSPASAADMGEGPTVAGAPVSNASASAVDLATVSSGPSKISESEPTDADILGLEPLTLKGDVQPLAQRVSAHLRQRDGNIKLLIDEIKKFGAESLLQVKEEHWPALMDAIRPLLAD